MIHSQSIKPHFHTSVCCQDESGTEINSQIKLFRIKPHRLLIRDFAVSNEITCILIFRLWPKRVKLQPHWVRVYSLTHHIVVMTQTAGQRERCSVYVLKTLSGCSVCHPYVARCRIHKHLTRFSWERVISIICLPKVYLQDGGKPS